MSSSGYTGESGQNAAKSTESAFKQAGDAMEGLRKNINSFIDEIGNSADGNKTHGSTGIHPDAKKTGDELAKGAGTATGKVEEVFDQHKKR